MILNFTSLLSDGWMDRLAQQFNRKTLSPSRIESNDGNGNAVIESFDLDCGVVAIYWEFFSKKPIYICKEAIPTDEYTLVYFINGAPDQKNRPDFGAGNFTPIAVGEDDGSDCQDLTKSGALFQLREKTQWQFLTITMSASFLLKNLHPNDNHSLADIDRIISRYPLIYLCRDNCFATQPVSQFVADKKQKIGQMLQYKAYSYWLLFEFVNNVILSALPAVQLQPRQDDHPDVKRIREVEKKFFGDPNLPSMKFLSREAGMSLTKFRYLFKEIYGIPVYDYYMQQRMKKAADLLDKGLTVSQVSATVGFTKVANFSKAFKQYFDRCPSELRTRSVFTN